MKIFIMTRREEIKKIIKYNNIIIFNIIVYNIKMILSS